MSVLSELNELLSPILPLETGIFSGVPPNEYAVLVPMTDEYAFFADNAPQIDVPEVRISLFCKGNYIQKKNQILSALLAADFTITERRYVEYETDTGFNHYSIDCAKYFEIQEE
jgi:hypothetical protein